MVVIHEDIAKWVMNGIPDAKWVEGMKAIGDVKDGELIAGVAFEYQNNNAMWGHQYITKPPCKAFWINVADYIFNQCNCKRFSAFVEVQNEKAIRLNKHIGFVVEATLKDAGNKGDLLVMTLWKDNCKILRWIK